MCPETLTHVYTQPFFHLIANSIAEEVGEDDPRAVIATTMVAFAFSSILTGEVLVNVRYCVGLTLVGAIRLDLLPSRRAQARDFDRLFPSAYPSWVRLALPRYL